jgi:protein-S-isoprenylcysteine O-methyltransferase Ste14
MSLLPEFELGFLNAWILLLYFPLHPLIFLVVDKLVGNGDIMKKMGDVPFENKETIVAVVSMIIVLLLLVASIFLPLEFGTAWFYVGMAVYLIGLVMFLAPIFTIAKTPAGQPFTDGMYRYSRHPMAIGGSLTFIGAGMTTLSPIFVLLAVVGMFLDMRLVIAEERGCLAIYGDEYQAYMDSTHRLIGMPKSGRHSFSGK